MNKYFILVGTLLITAALAKPICHNVYNSENGTSGTLCMWESGDIPPQGFVGNIPAPADHNNLESETMK